MIYSGIDTLLYKEMDAFAVEHIFNNRQADKSKDDRQGEAQTGLTGLNKTKKLT